MQPERSDVLLAAMAAGGDHAEYTPVQIQKLMFVVDREIPSLVGGPHFAFKPDVFGPFDDGVYDVIRDLADRNMIRIEASWDSPIYSLHDNALELGRLILAQLPAEASRFIQGAAYWIRTLSLRQLVASINSIYPDMAVNSAVPKRRDLCANVYANYFDFSQNCTQSQAFFKGFLRVLDGWVKGPDETKTFQASNFVFRSSLPTIGEIWNDVGDDLQSATQDYAADPNRAPQ